MVPGLLEERLRRWVRLRKKEGMAREGQQKRRAEPDFLVPRAIVTETWLSLLVEREAPGLASSAWLNHSGSVSGG